MTREEKAHCALVLSLAAQETGISVRDAMEVLVFMLDQAHAMSDGVAQRELEGWVTQLEADMRMRRQ